MEVIVEVTQADIDEGIRNDCARCPEALAIRRATGNDLLIVDSTKILRSDDLGVFQLDCVASLLPDIANRIRNFDNGFGMTPHKWTIELPDEWVIRKDKP